MDCTRQITRQYNGRNKRSRKSIIIKRTEKCTFISVIIRVAEFIMSKVRSGVMRPLISASALLAVIGIVGGMESGFIPPIAAIPVCLVLCIGTLALVKD